MRLLKLSTFIVSAIYISAIAVRWTGVGEERPPVVFKSPWPDGKTPLVVEAPPQAADPQLPARKATEKKPAIDLLQTLLGVEASKIPVDPIGEKQLRVWCEQHLIGRRVSLSVVVRDVLLEERSVFGSDDWRIRIRVDEMELEDWSRSQDFPAWVVDAPQLNAKRKLRWTLKVTMRYSEWNCDFSFHVNGSDKARLFKALDDKAPHTLTGIVDSLDLHAPPASSVRIVLRDYSIDGLRSDN